MLSTHFFQRRRRRTNSRCQPDPSQRTQGSCMSQSVHAAILESFSRGHHRLAKCCSPTLDTSACTAKTHHNSVDSYSIAARALCDVFDPGVRWDRGWLGSESSSAASGNLGPENSRGDPLPNEKEGNNSFQTGNPSCQKCRQGRNQ